MRTVEVFADFLCPFTHAGLHTLIDRRTALGHNESRFRIPAWPLELINGKPMDAHHIGKPEAVAPIAASFGLKLLGREETSDAVRADWEEGQARGVIGSPHFFTDDGESRFCPALDISRDDVGNFVIAWKQGAEAFVDNLLR